MGKEGRAWHQQQDTKVRAPGAQTISTELLFSPLWRWARKGSGPSLPPQPKPSTGPPPSKHLSPPARCCDQCGAGVFPLPGAAYQPLPRPGGGAFSNSPSSPSFIPHIEPFQREFEFFPIWLSWLGMRAACMQHPQFSTSSCGAHKLLTGRHPAGSRQKIRLGGDFEAQHIPLLLTAFHARVLSLITLFTAKILCTLYLPQHTF